MEEQPEPPRTWAPCSRRSARTACRTSTRSRGPAAWTPRRCGGTRRGCGSTWTSSPRSPRTSTDRSSRSKPPTRGWTRTRRSGPRGARGAPGPTRKTSPQRLRRTRGRGDGGGGDARRDGVGERMSPSLPRKSRVSPRAPPPGWGGDSRRATRAHRGGQQDECTARGQGDARCGGVPVAVGDVRHAIGDVTGADVTVLGGNGLECAGVGKKVCIALPVPVDPDDVSAVFKKKERRLTLRLTPASSD